MPDTHSARVVLLPLLDADPVRGKGPVVVAARQLPLALSSTQQATLHLQHLQVIHLRRLVVIR